MRARHCRHDHGFSLLELVIVLVLVSLLAVAATQPILAALRSRSAVATNLSAIDGLRFATERIVRELRQTRYDAQGSGFQLLPLDALTGTTNASRGICFTRVGGAAGTTLSSVAVRQSGTLATLDRVTLPACTAASPMTLANNISAIRFDYWRFGSGSTALPLSLTDPNFSTLLAYVDVTLSATPASGTPISYRSRVVLRNGAWGAKK
jgi:prepilin-type N-terminal cleavage/methylation domain-containing protein